LARERLAQTRVTSPT